MLVVRNMIMFSSITGVSGDRPGPVVVPHGPSARATSGVVTADPLVLSDRAAASVARAARPMAALSVLAAVMIGAAQLRHRYLRWGVTNTEQTEPGRRRPATRADVSATRAITIEAAAEDVWPWIAQLGQGRGGFYSYDWLENLVARTSTFTTPIASCPNGSSRRRLRGPTRTRTAAAGGCPGTGSGARAARQRPDGAGRTAVRLHLGFRADSASRTGRPGWWSASDTSTPAGGQR